MPIEKICTLPTGFGNERRYLFPREELGTGKAEHNRIHDFPEIAQRLEQQLLKKANTEATPGLPEQPHPWDISFFGTHVEGKLPFPPLEQGRPCAFIPWGNTRPQTAVDAPTSVWRAASNR